MKPSPNPMPCPLPELRAARIDPLLPSQERVRLFAAALGNPYRFRVGQTPVEVCFASDAPSLQTCLTSFFENL